MVGVARKKTNSPALGAFPRNVTDLKSVQLIKADPPILVTPSGIVMLVRLVLFIKAPGPMLVTLSEIVMLVRRLHSAKVPSSMLVTPFPIMMLVSLVQT